MKLIVLLPSEEYRASAGSRIRYGRIAPELRRRGIELTLESIAQFNPLTADCDAILITKCHDARSLIAAVVASDRGKLVGVDLFDDYFSDATDSRLLRYRSWLSQLIETCDFALCSTAVMAKVVAHWRAGLQIHVLNDPSPEDDIDKLSGLIARKLAHARDNLRIRVSWFGVGDNPYFSVGLADLAAYGTALGELARSGFEVELTILTNRRSLTSNGLALIGKLPVAAQIREWSESAEADVLRETLVAFLPVNAQGFSAAKSLNRAVTALSYGCQILSMGYPLYAALEPLIYRDPRELAVDVGGGSLRFSSQTMSQYRTKIGLFASAAREAERLGEFLGSLKPQARRRLFPLSVVHGQSTRVEIHRLVRAVSGLSVASPYTSAGFDFDVLFRGGPTGLQMLVSRTASRSLLPHVRHQSKRVGDYLCLAETDCDLRVPEVGEWSKEPVPFQLATYSETMEQIQRRLANAFGVGRMIISETSPLPLGPAPKAFTVA
jgi:hypothetical protein